MTLESKRNSDEENACSLCGTTATLVCITSIHTTKKQRRDMKNIREIQMVFALFVCAFVSVCVCIRVHIFAFYDISIFHLCNFIICGIVYLLHSFSMPWMKMIAEKYFENATHIHSVKSTIKFSLDFSNSMLYLHVPNCFFFRVESLLFCSIDELEFTQ